MPLSIASIAFPASVLMMVLRAKGPVQAFMKAGAVSPETARRPESLGIGLAYMLKPGLRSGALVALGDGRFYANAAVVRRRQRLFAIAIVALLAIGAAAGGWWLFTAGPLAG